MEVGDLRLLPEAVAVPLLVTMVSTAKAVVRKNAITSTNPQLNTQFSRLGRHRQRALRILLHRYPDHVA